MSNVVYSNKVMVAYNHDFKEMLLIFNQETPIIDPVSSQITQTESIEAGRFVMSEVVAKSLIKCMTDVFEQNKVPCGVN